MHTHNFSSTIFNTLLLALISAKYPNYNLALVKVFNGYPVILIVEINYH